LTILINVIPFYLLTGIVFSLF